MSSGSRLFFHALTRFRQPSIQHKIHKILRFTSQRIKANLTRCASVLYIWRKQINMLTSHRQNAKANVGIDIAKGKDRSPDVITSIHYFAFCAATVGHLIVVGVR